MLHNFAGIASGKQDGDGAEPNGGLVLDKKGAIYGTSYYGGNEGGSCGSVGCGTVFKLAPPTKNGGAWTQKTLHVFKGIPDGVGLPQEWCSVVKAAYTAQPSLEARATLLRVLPLSLPVELTARGRSA